MCREYADLKPVVTPRFEKVTGDIPHRPGPDSLVVKRRIDEEVDAGVAVLGFVFLPVLDHPADLSVHQDGQTG